MKNKQFKSDKNIILKKTQYKLGNKLLKKLIINTIKEYQLKNNSLGIIDNAIESLENYKVKNEKEFYFFYNKIAAIYRYKYGKNQLSFIWDGRSHSEFYEEKWISYFKKEIKYFLKNSSFIKIILKLTALNYQTNKFQNLHYKLSSFVKQRFKIQVFKRKGIDLKYI